MEKSLIVLLVLITICYQKSPKIKQNKYIFTTDIPSAYSITSQIFTAMKQQQIAKNRPVTGFQPLPQLPNKRKKQPKVQFMGFVNEASAANKPPINLQNQAATIVIEGNNKAIPMKSDSIIFEDKQVSMKQLKNYVLPNIDEKSVFDQKGVLIKSNKSGYTEQAPITPVQKKIEGPKTYNFDVNKKIDQMRQIIKNVMKDPKNSINTGNSQTSYLNPTQDTISSIAGPHNKNIRIDNKKFYPFQTEAEQIRREQEQQIIKILFTSLFFIAILLVVFGYRPQGKKQTQRIVSKEEEESTLK